MNRVSFENLHKNVGIPICEIGDASIEFQIGKGFSFSGREEYEDWECEVISIQDFLDATEIWDWHFIKIVVY